MNNTGFDLESTIEQIKKHLPTQGPLKDYIFLNSLACFQSLPFHEAMKRSSEIFGYKTYLDLNEYRDFYAKGQIRKEVLEKVLIEQKGAENLNFWKQKLLEQDYQIRINSRVGKLREAWKKG